MLGRARADGSHRLLRLVQPSRLHEHAHRPHLLRTQRIGGGLFRRDFIRTGEKMMMPPVAFTPGELATIILITITIILLARRK